MAEFQTVGEALRSASSFLWDESPIAIAESPEAREAILRGEVEELFQWAAGWTRTELLTRMSEPIPSRPASDAAAKFQNALLQRSQGVPLQYITGEAGFYGRTFRVKPGCLIPRPETEWLVEAALQWLQSSRIVDAQYHISDHDDPRDHTPRHYTPCNHTSRDRVEQNAVHHDASSQSLALADADRGVDRRVERDRTPESKPVVLDVGTGSGAIAATLALEFPEMEMHAVDLSSEALEIAKANAAALGAQIVWHHEDGLELLAERRLSLSLLVSNPPYIPSADVDALEIEVREYEPRLALDGGDDGLDFYRRLVGIGDVMFAPGPAALFLEVGAGQAPMVRDMFEQASGWQQWSFRLISDLRGIERIVAGER